MRRVAKPCHYVLFFYFKAEAVCDCSYVNTASQEAKQKICREWHLHFTLYLK